MFILICFTFTTVIPRSYAGEIVLPAADQMLAVGPTFTPVILKGMVIHPEDPLKFDFLMDTGTVNASGEDLRKEAEKSIKYFLASLTVPEDDLWVNLSPFEKDRVIPDGFGKTVMGRDLLAEDYVLKQLSSSLLYPETSLGKEFWTKVYETASREMGTVDINVDNFNRVWIVPAEAQVWEHDGRVLILKSRLKVMLETDYLASQNSATQSQADRIKTPDNMPSESSTMTQERSKQILREILVPAIEKEVNEGEHFARLRQVYAAMILSEWYKVRLKESLLAKAYADQNKVAGIEFADGANKEDIYNRYLEAVKKGVFNYIREENDPATGDIVPRKYFSGGIIGKNIKALLLTGIVVGALAALPMEVRAQARDATQPKGKIVLIAAGAQDVGNGANPVYLAQAGTQGVKVGNAGTGQSGNRGGADSTVEKREAIRKQYLQDLEERRMLNNLKKLAEGTVQEKFESISLLEKTTDTRAIIGLLKALGDANADVRLNAIYMLGVKKDKRAVPGLLAILEKDNVPILKATAVTALNNIGDERAIEVLAMVVANEKFIVGDKIMLQGVQVESVKTLFKLGGASSEVLFRTMAEQSGIDRIKNAYEVWKTDKARAFDLLVGALSDANPEARWKAAVILGSVQEIKALDGLIKLLEDQNEFVAGMSAFALSNIKNQRATDALLNAMQHGRSVTVRAAAAHGLVEIAGAKEIALNGVLDFLESGNEMLQGSAALLLPKIGISNPRVVDGLEKLMVSSSNNLIGMAAGTALWSLADQRAIPGLLKLAEHPSAQVRMLAVLSLANIDGKESAKGLVGVVRRDTNDEIRNVASGLLIRSKYLDTYMVDDLLRALSDTAPRTRSNALGALGRIGGQRAIDGLLQSLRKGEAFTGLNPQDLQIIFSNFGIAFIRIGEPALDRLLAALEDENEDYNVQAVAGAVFVDLGDVRAVKGMLKLLGNKNPEIRQAVKGGLMQMPPSAIDIIRGSLDKMTGEQRRLAEEVVQALEKKKASTIDKAQETSDRAQAALQMLNPDILQAREANGVNNLETNAAGLAESAREAELKIVQEYLATPESIQVTSAALAANVSDAAMLDDLVLWVQTWVQAHQFLTGLAAGMLAPKITKGEDGSYAGLLFFGIPFFMIDMAYVIDDGLKGELLYKLVSSHPELSAGFAVGLAAFVASKKLNLSRDTIVNPLRRITIAALSAMRHTGLLLPLLNSADYKIRSATRAQLEKRTAGDNEARFKVGLKGLSSSETDTQEWAAKSLIDLDRIGTLVESKLSTDSFAFGLVDSENSVREGARKILEARAARGDATAARYIRAYTELHNMLNALSMQLMPSERLNLLREAVASKFDLVGGRVFTYVSGGIAQEPIYESKWVDSGYYDSMTGESYGSFENEIVGYKDVPFPGRIEVVKKPATTDSAQKDNGIIDHAQIIRGNMRLIAIRVYAGRQAIDKIIPYLSDEFPKVRAKAREALEKLTAGDKEARYQVGLKGLESFGSDSRLWAINLLSALNDQRAIGPISERLSDRDDIRQAARAALDKLTKGDNEARFQVGLKGLKSFDSDSRLWAINLLSALNDQRAIGPIAEKLNEKESVVRQAARTALDKLTVGDNEARLQVGLKGLESTHADSLTWAINLLGNLGEQRAIVPIADKLGDEQVAIRQPALVALNKLKGDNESFKQLTANDYEMWYQLGLKGLESPHADILTWAINLLGDLSDQRAIEKIIKIGETFNESSVVLSAMQALDRLGAVNLALSLKPRYVYLAAEERLKNEVDARLIARQPGKQSLLDMKEQAYAYAREGYDFEVAFTPGYDEPAQLFVLYDSSLSSSGTSGYYIDITNYVEESVVIFRGKKLDNASSQTAENADHPKKTDKLAGDSAQKNFSVSNPVQLENLAPLEKKTGRIPVILLIGIPASGKGTVGPMLAERLGMKHVSAGVILREAAARLGVAFNNDQNFVAEQEKQYFREHAGELKGGFILDYHPMTQERQKLTEEALREAGFEPVVMVRVDIEPELALKRELARGARLEAALSEAEREQAFQFRVKTDGAINDWVAQRFSQAGRLRTLDNNATLEDLKSGVTTLASELGPIITQKLQEVGTIDKAQRDLGGIDLDPKQLDLQIKRDGNGVPLPVSTQPWETINIQGFIPVIYSIEPANLPLLMGLNAQEASAPTAGASSMGSTEIPAGKELEPTGV